MADIKEKLKNLESKTNKLEPSLKKHKQTLEKSTDDDSQICDEMFYVKSAHVLTEIKVKYLKLLRNILESSREELKNFKWKP